MTQELLYWQALNRAMDIEMLAVSARVLDKAGWHAVRAGDLQ